MVAIRVSKTVTPQFQARTIREPIYGSHDDNRKARAATTNEVRKRNPGCSTHGIPVSGISVFFTKISKALSSMSHFVACVEFWNAVAELDSLEYH
jgi:hypothetical protein